jgi:hypothetical protein
MSAWPEADEVGRFLAGVRRRMVALRTLEGAAAGLLLAALISLTGTRSATVLASIVFAAILGRAIFGDRWRFGWWRSLPGIARELERRTTTGRNLIVTAAELSQGARGYVHDAVMTHAAQKAREIDAPRLFPARAAVSAVILGAIVLAAAMLRPTSGGRFVGRQLIRASAPVVRRVELTVVPPAYSALPRTTTIDPTRIEARAGSRIEIRLQASATSVSLETLEGKQPMRDDAGAFTAIFTAHTDGFLAFEPRDSAGTTGTRRLVGLAVTPDSPPRVTLKSPGRDLFFSVVPDTLPVAISADDDLALESLHLRYTAVSGSGERFTFVERDVPITVNKANPASWTARGTWRLSDLGLSPGDLLVYRAVAMDRRPGAPPVESESYVLEVVTPGAIAAEGFAADDQRDRYAVSQQMVILKTERLIARRASLAADSVSAESRLLAAEQRSVRAEFVFMMGGELEDMTADAAGTLELNEVAEAEAESDILAGRQQNQGRVDMMRAIHAMSRASSALTDANLDQALQSERTALNNLMRAFSRSRFILRALTQRERIDLERRLSGSLALTAGVSGPPVAHVPDERAVALRRLLVDVAAMATNDSAASNRAVTSAQGVLRADPGSPALQRLTARVQEIAGDARSRQAPGLALRLDSLLKEVSLQIELFTPGAPASRAALDADVLEGALRDATSRSVRRP